MLETCNRLNYELNDVIQEYEFDHAFKFHLSVVGTENLNICPNMFSFSLIILEKSDYYTMISGKISFYFNLSFEIKDKTIEFDENCNVQRAEFVVRAYMQGGRFSDGWGSCERREKKFLKPNHDIPSTTETRAKNKACQDLLGIGEYRSGARQIER
ncbi:hypothetical protein UlMin_028628 [Ulmus minor]